jgi:hypothetical protein
MPENSPAKRTSLTGQNHHWNRLLLADNEAGLGAMA